MDDESQARWRGWLRHIRRDQIIWVSCSFIGMALPCMMSLEFIRNAPVSDDRVAALTADGLASRFPGLCFVLVGQHALRRLHHPGSQCGLRRRLDRPLVDRLDLDRQLQGSQPPGQQRDVRLLRDPRGLLCLGPRGAHDLEPAQDRHLEHGVGERGAWLFGLSHAGRQSHAAAAAPAAQSLHASGAGRVRLASFSESPRSSCTRPSNSGAGPGRPKVLDWQRFHGVRLLNHA